MTLSGWVSLFFYSLLRDFSLVGVSVSLRDSCLIYTRRAFSPLIPF